MDSEPSEASISFAGVVDRGAAPNGVHRPPRADATVAEVAGDHPDPMTLASPGYDEQGLLRWASVTE